MKITTKIAKNGAVNIYLDGKRVKEEIAVDTLCDNGGKIYFADIHGYTGHTITATFASSISAYKWLIKMGNKSINYADGSWLIDCKDYKTGEIVTILEKDERDYVINDPQLKAFCNGEILEVTQEVIINDDNAEVNPSDYAVTEDALEVAVNAEIQNANTAKINDLKWEIRYTEGSINDLDKNHIAHAPNDQSLQERRAELVNELAALKAQLAELLPTEAVKAEIQAANNAEPDTTELSDEEIAEIKRRSQINAIKSRIATYERAIERQYDAELENSLIEAKAQLAEIEPANTQPMTIEIPAEGTHEFTIGDDTVCFFNGKFHSVFSAKYHMAIVRDLVGCFSYCIYNDGDTEVFNVREHAVSYDNFMETLHQRGNREKLLALRKDYIITDRLSENSSSLWYINGKRSSHIKVWNLLQEYGLTLAEFLAENEAYINECIAASCKKIAIKKQADFYADKIKRDAQPSGDNVFDLLPTLDELNDFSETDPYLMDDDAEYTDRDARFNYGERYAAALTEKLSQYDPTVEVTYDIDDDDEDVYYLKFDGIYGTHYALSGVESAFHRLKKDIAEEEFMKNVDGTLDDKIAALKRKRIRDSINRAIKHCIRNRIGYLKSHNSKMEKYEYELLCLLQGARRELEVA